jgi:hypothetical protein
MLHSSGGYVRYDLVSAQISRIEYLLSMGYAKPAILPV